MTRLLTILGYGVFEKTNQIYKDYLDNAISLIKNHEITDLIICGGFTNKNLQISEASSIKSYLIENNINSNIFLEEKSITTPQNLKFSQEIISTNSLLPESIIITCDSIRAPKVYYLALRYLSNSLNQKSTEEEIYLTLLEQAIQKKLDFTKNLELSYQKLTIYGFDQGRKEKEISEQIVATMEEIGGCNYPSVDKYITDFKRKQFEISN